MKSNRYPSLLIVLAVLLSGCGNSHSFGQSALKLSKEISLPNVKGRIDHLDIDVPDQIVFVAALGNNTVEVADMKSGKVLHTITGLSEPQGLAYIAKHHELFVANGGTGECLFYNTMSWQKTASIKYDDDADDARYDAGADQIYVGYGSGGIGIIDAGTHKQIANIKLPAHPESFQLDAKANKLWVNLPGSGMIGVADIKQHKLIDKWKKLLPRANFPMAYDAAQHRVIAGYRVPATLKVLDANTGKEIFSSAMAGDADDLYWDDKTKQILVSGGSGSVNVFKQTGPATYKEAANIPTRDSARTSLWVPELRLFILAARATDGKPAALLIYRLAD
jgi:DNA-binding beta-propeller fold protein YncE